MKNTVILIIILIAVSCTGNNKQEVEKKRKPIQLDESKYEVFYLTSNKVVSNYHVLLKENITNKDSVKVFVDKFRAQWCVKGCNVYIYDSKDILLLIDKYPLEGNEYVKFADHLVASSPFDAPSVIMWYPYKDEQYKKYKQ